MRSRPAIVHIQESVDGDDAAVTVTLSWEDEEFSGQAVGSPEPTARPRLVGEATLSAIQHAAHDSLVLDLAAIATQELGVARVAVAQVHIRNMLDALNRRLSLL